MNSRTLSILGLATLAIIVVAWGINVWRTPSASQSIALYPELQGKLDTIQAIKVFGASDRLEVQLDRTKQADGSERFVVQQRGYPADDSKVRGLLINLENAKRREEKTSNPNNYAALKVEDTKASDASSKRLELVGAPINLIVGKHDSNGIATYVRRAEDKASWLIDVTLEVSKDPRQWLQTDVLDIAANRIANIRVEMAGEKSYELFKKNRTDANFDINGIPKGRELNSVSAPNAAAQTFTALTLEDVETASNLEIIKVVGTAHVTMFDGLTLDCTGYAVGDLHWMVFKPAFDEALAKKNFEADPKASKEDADKALQDAMKKGADEAAALDKKLSSWAFAIQTHKFDSFFKPIETLLKKKEAAKSK